MRHSQGMRFLLILLAIPSVAQADPGYVTYVETVYRLSCERTVLRMFTKYGAGKPTPPEQEKMAVTYCSGNVTNITKADAWKKMGSPAGTGCMDVVRSLTELAPKRYPAKDDLFAELCYSITIKDG